MNRILALLLLSLSLVSASAAQKLTKPKQMPVASTPEQAKKIAQGTALHDAKKFDDAIAVYQSVLNENPDNVEALYEMALSLYTKGDKDKARELAFKGANYVSDDLALFYGIIGNVLDDEGKGDEAIKVYSQAADILKSYPEMRARLSSVEYNLGVTYLRQKKLVEARTALKRSIEDDPGYASPHYLLSMAYAQSYKVPAILAAARLLSLEFNSERSKRGADLIYSSFTPSKDANGHITINLQIDSPKDEGDFTLYDLILGTLTTVDKDKDKQKNMSENDRFVDALGSLSDMLADDKKLSSTFVGKTYVPFMAEMKKRGYMEAFGNVVLYVHDNGNRSAGAWIDANTAKVREMFNWAKAYKPAP